MHKFIFFFLSIGIITAGIIMVSAENIARGIFSHVLALLGIAGIYILLYAEFMAGLQVLISAGGVSIILLFALMLTKPAKGTVRALDHPQRFPSFIISAIILCLLLFCIVKTKWPFQDYPSRVTTTEVIGKVMFIDYIIPFEIVSLILLVALIGAVVVGTTEKDKGDDKEEGP